MTIRNMNAMKGWPAGFLFAGVVAAEAQTPVGFPEVVPAPSGRPWHLKINERLGR